MNAEQNTRPAPYAIKSLWELYQNTINPKGTMTDALNSFGGRLIAVTARTDIDRHPEVLEDLAQLWLHNISQTLIYDESTKCIFYADLDRFFKCAVPAGVFEKVCPIAANHHILACILLQASAELRGEFCELENNCLNALLSRWVGVPVDHLIPLTPRETCDILYGTGVWDLYRPDVADDKMLGTYLFKNGIEPIGIRPRTASLHVSLPDYGMA